jgi:uncharacterized membrane protein YagU involved in acid resistance
VAGGLIAGVLDILDAWIFFGLRGVSPVVILQSIASGVLGRSAFQGGMSAAALGLALHFVIAHLVAAVFVIASWRLPPLTKRPILWGAVYGIAVFFTMRDVVLPLAGVSRAAFSWPVFLNGVTIHIVGIGIPIALVARRFSRN